LTAKPRGSTADPAWLAGLKDAKGKARILARLRSAEFGNLGDVKPAGRGLSEMRIDVGLGYRMYFIRRGSLVFLLLGGDKSTQFLAALADVAKARGMSTIARDAGLGRESLYKALAPGAKPRYDTILEVLNSLGEKLTITG
jgi:putative addiction module killer protein